MMPDNRTKFLPATWGLLTQIATKHEVSPAYVSRLANGRRAGRTDKARAILQDLAVASQSSIEPDESQAQTAA
jgi:hypothetical protein